MDGTEFGGTIDPRMSRMLAPSPDGQYRGLDVNVVGFGDLTDDEQPMNLFGDNNGKPVQRARPRYNSEYVWNQAGLEPIGGLESDYHTKQLWITCPGDDCQ